MENPPTQEPGIQEPTKRQPDDTETVHQANGTNPVAAVVVAAIIVVGGLMVLAKNPGMPSRTQIVDAIPETEISAEVRSPEEVTLEQFNRIYVGMTYQEVRGIIGADGNKLSEAAVAGDNAVVYQWNNQNFYNIAATFHNNRLLSKFEFGLHQVTVPNNWTNPPQEMSLYGSQFDRGRIESDRVACRDFSDFEKLTDLAKADDMAAFTAFEIDRVRTRACLALRAGTVVIVDDANIKSEIFCVRPLSANECVWVSSKAVKAFPD